MVIKVESTIVMLHRSWMWEYLKDGHVCVCVCIKEVLDGQEIALSETPYNPVFLFDTRSMRDSDITILELLW